MSGIYIPSMEMPTRCYNCKIDCGLVSHIDRNIHPFWRSEKCPLIPVPDHGRLIDSDALAEMLEKYKKEYTLTAKKDIVRLHKAWGLHDAELMAESLPTIIPASTADRRTPNENTQ